MDFENIREHVANCLGLPLDSNEKIISETLLEFRGDNLDELEKMFQIDSAESFGLIDSTWTQLNDVQRWLAISQAYINDINAKANFLPQDERQGFLDECNMIYRLAMMLQSHSKFTVERNQILEYLEMFEV